MKLLVMPRRLSSTDSLDRCSRVRRLHPGVEFLGSIFTSPLLQPKLEPPSSCKSRNGAVCPHYLQRTKCTVVDDVWLAFDGVQRFCGSLRLRVLIGAFGSLLPVVSSLLTVGVVLFASCGGWNASLNINAIRPLMTIGTGAPVPSALLPRITRVNRLSPVMHGRRRMCKRKTAVNRRYPVCPMGFAATKSVRSIERGCSRD